MKLLALAKVSRYDGGGGYAYLCRKEQLRELAREEDRARRGNEHRSLSTNKITDGRRPDAAMED